MKVLDPAHHGYRYIPMWAVAFPFFTKEVGEGGE